MRKDPDRIAWSIKCNTINDCKQILELLQEQSRLDSVYVDVAKSFPNGIEIIKQEHHRLGDYFDKIEIAAKSDNPPLLQVIFHRRPDAGRFWKDLMVNILRSAQEAADNVVLDRVPEWES